MTGNMRKEKRAYRQLRLRITALIAVMALAAVCFAGTAFAVDLSAKSCSLTVNIATTDADFAQDLEKASLTVDIYKIAEAVSVSGFDTYSLQVTPESSFISLKEQVETATTMTDPAAGTDAWTKISQAAAALVQEGKAGEPNFKGEIGNSTDGMDPGLYLVITHGDSEEYLAGEPLAGIALTDTYEYHFAPQLISLPAKAGEEGFFNTAQSSGEWMNDYSIALKAQRERRTGSIRINKSLNGYNSGYVATFVFSVEAELDGENVYSNIFTMNFDSTGTKEVAVEDLPVGASVTVTEVYDGAGYSLASGYAAEQTNAVSAGEEIAFTFVNEPDGTVTGGSGVLNSFTSDGSRWNWNPDYTSDSSNQ